MDGCIREPVRKLTKKRDGEQALRNQDDEELGVATVAICAGCVAIVVLPCVPHQEGPALAQY